MEDIQVDEPANANEALILLKRLVSGDGSIPGGCMIGAYSIGKVVEILLRRGPYVEETGGGLSKEFASFTSRGRSTVDERVGFERIKTVGRVLVEGTEEARSASSELRQKMCQVLLWESHRVTDIAKQGAKVRDYQGPVRDRADMIRPRHLKHQARSTRGRCRGPVFET